jgi:GT2 family glycosyltransferase
MGKLNIIIVGHNEEKNLPKLFKSLEYFEGKVDLNIIYCDQESTDDSVKIAKEY